MHEQKLLEISVTQEGLTAAIAAAKAAGKEAEARSLATDLEILRRMEDDAARFGQAVGLDSASTFECIVDRDRYYFMEVNTRIQVEHRVTELCYSLRFENPDDPRDSFVVESLVEAMALLARHKERLPKPVRTPRFPASVEARLNATDASLLKAYLGFLLGQQAQSLLAELHYAPLPSNIDSMATAQLSQITS